MNILYRLTSILLLFTNISCSQDKNKTDSFPKQNVGGMCEGCEAVYESPIPLEELNWIDTLPDFSESGPKLEISGVIYKSDGVTPAPGVILYIYHTDQKGYYSKKGGESGWGLRHGYIKGWIKTNDMGEYKFYTLKPAPYPNGSDPAHIHPVIKEPEKNEYWIDEFVFEDDPLVNESYRKRIQNRCGSGIISLTMNSDGILIGKRDLILGKNIPYYTK
ncbi:MAG: intradiol ring-cleavage dioxygenase [Chlorobi bacterium]|nr:intradiol ring-cleavage dioxygenase [Chlorobiota bacterium]MCI0716619.1 intradiol ring-cleavage dioxygenase [Chlorobiota bacterium]